MNELQALIHLSVSSIDPMPMAGSRIISILQREDWELHQIVEAIRFDPSLSTQILALANSAAHAGQAPIADVNQAIMRIGPARVLALVVASVVKGQMKTPQDRCGLSEGMLWRHSVAAALAVQECVPFCELKPASECFVAALLHDVGLLMSEQLMRVDGKIQAYLDSIQTGEITESERMACFDDLELLGLSHERLGAKLIREWKLPEPIAHAIELHHRPGLNLSKETHVMAEFIKLADYVATQIGERCEVEHRLTRTTLVGLGISNSGLAQLIEVTGEKLASTLAVFES